MAKVQSFGRQNDRVRLALRAEPAVQVRAEQGASAGGIIVAILAGAAVLVIGAVSLIWALSPFTHSASRVSYSVVELREMAVVRQMGSVLSSDVKTRAEQLYGIDVSRIMLPAAREQSKAMQEVAEQCITTKLSPTSKMIVMPTRGHEAFAVMTEYLDCALQFNKQRLCDPTERKRLVEQLIQFKDRRQNVLGFERAREALLATPMAQFATKMSEMSDASSGPVGRPFLGEDIDERIVKGIATLNREGYLTAEDFSWRGMFLPAEYAPALASSAKGVARCG